MKQADSSHYDFEKYMNLARWACYYIQIKEVLKLKPKSVLEVGPGDGLFGWYMKKNGVEYSSADHADDISSNLKVNLGFEKIPVEDNSYDVVVAFQVLEHVPFEKVPFAISELRRVAKKYVFLDIPQYGYHLNLAFKVPGLKYFQWHALLPRVKQHKFDGFHYWEIGKKGYPKSKVREVLGKEMKIISETSYYQKPGERFYLLEK